MALILPIHGGDLKAAEARWGAHSWLDLSTGINPWPYPVGDVSFDAWHRLPGAAEEEALRVAACRRFGASHALAAPGTSALIQALPRLRKPGTVHVAAPTYGEHARAWQAAGHILVDGDADVVVVVNPNNPDGRVVAPDALLDLADAQAAKGGLLVVDEAFGDMSPALSVAGSLRPGLVVLRSFGKFYGLAGLRLGFALAQPDLLAGLAAQLGPWPVSGPALAVGAAALSDDAWAEDMKARLAAWSARLDGVLEGGGLRVRGGTSLFRLAEHARAGEVYDCLGRAGILVRAFDYAPTWLRFGLPADEAGLERLARALA